MAASSKIGVGAFHIEVRLFDELVETFDLERLDEVARLVEYMNYHSRNRRYELKRVGSGVEVR